MRRRRCRRTRSKIAELREESTLSEQDTVAYQRVVDRTAENERRQQEIQSESGITSTYLISHEADDETVAYRRSPAFAIVCSESLGQPLEDFLAGLRCTRDDLRDRNILDLAEKMRAELDRGPCPVRVPIVVTDEELDRMPLFTATQNLDAREGAANVKAGSSARDVVMRAAAQAATWSSKHSE